jgi:hypothetical protein
LRYLNAAGVRHRETFDTSGEALDFKAKLRLMSRSDALDEVDVGKEALPRLFGAYVVGECAQVVDLDFDCVAGA